MKKKTFLSMALVMFHLLSNAEVLKCSVQEKEVYLANKETIDSIFLFRYPEEMAKLNRLYYIPNDGKEKLEFFVKNREFKYICQDFLYKDSLERRVRNKLMIEKVYRDSINTILIPAYRNNISGENLSYALFCKKLLRLDSSQYAYIMDKAVLMARRIRKDYRVNLWNEEMDILKKTLDKSQLRSFFIRKNAEKIEGEFSKAWEKLKKAGLTEQLDSAKDAREALKFMNSRQMIKDLYRGYGTAQKKYLAELNKSKPKMISMLEGLDKKVKIEEKARSVGKEFIW